MAERRAKGLSGNNNSTFFSVRPSGAGVGKCKSCFRASPKYLALRLNPGAFDLVLDKGLFHHVPIFHWPAYVALVRRILRPRGVFHLHCHGPKLFLERYANAWLGWLPRAVNALCDGVIESGLCPPFRGRECRLG